MERSWGTGTGAETAAVAEKEAEAGAAAPAHTVDRQYSAATTSAQHVITAVWVARSGGF